MDADDLAKFEQFLDQVRNMRLHGSREHGPALKKPLLVLLVIARIEQDSLQENCVHFSDVRRDLDSLIQDFGGRPTGSGSRPEQPFSHLRTAPFWHLTTQESYPNRRTARVSDLMDSASFAYLDSKIFELLKQSPYLRARAVELVLDLWWSETLHEDLRERLGLAVTRLTPTRTRDPKFAREVLENYRYSCAFCGFQALVSGRATGIDAAHIRWRAQDGPDVLENGLALCKIHHWALDRGILGVSDDLRICVSRSFSCARDGGLPLESLGGQPFSTLPRSRSPNHMYLEWHRNHIYLGG